MIEILIFNNFGRYICSLYCDKKQVHATVKEWADLSALTNNDYSYTVKELGQ